MNPLVILKMQLMLKGGAKRRASRDESTRASQNATDKERTSQWRSSLDEATCDYQNAAYAEQNKNYRVLRYEATRASQNATHSTQERARIQNIEARKRQCIRAYQTQQWSNCIADMNQTTRTEYNAQNYMNQMYYWHIQGLVIN